MSTETREPVAGLQTALAHAGRLLDARPALAEEQAREILKVVPGQPDARLLHAAALRRLGRVDEALAGSAELARERPGWAPAHLEHGLCLAQDGQAAPAAAALERAVALEPRLGHGWRELAHLYDELGEEAKADRARARHLRASVNDPELIEAAAALCDNRLAVAERRLKDFLKRHPADIAAIRMLAEVAGRLGRYDDSEVLLERCLELAPGFDAARHNFASVLYRQNKPEAAIEHCDRLLQRDPQHRGYRGLRAAALTRIGEYQQAIDIYGRLLEEHPVQPKGWMSYGHALKTVGRQADAIAAYRKALEQAPHLGEVWWSLANLKTVRFEPGDLELMAEQLERPGLPEEDRLHLHFALGKALEDEGRFDDSFGHYAQGAAIRRAQVGYDPEEMSRHVERSKRFFTPELFQARDGWGSPAADPIFIVGLPRSGSTLIEQILSSHSLVEGTMELPDLVSMVRRLGGPRRRGEPSAYPEMLADLGPEDMRALGEEYLERTRIQRKTDRPFFIDKLPNNFAHVGLIRLILPNARIIDARRHPMATGFSGFKQHFARGQHFTYGLEDLGRYYRDYVELMAHFDRVLPGHVHRVTYERMVADPEGQVRALLDYCGLEFQDACLRFHETERAVRTASSEQVRRPIFSEGLDHWRNYQRWLGPLATALGPVLEAYPEPPAT